MGTTYIAKQWMTRFVAESLLTVEERVRGVTARRAIKHLKGDLCHNGRYINCGKSGGASQVKSLTDLPKIAQVQFAEAFKEHVAYAKSKGLTALSEQEATAKFLSAYAEAEKLRVQYDDARGEVQNALDRLQGKLEVLGRTKTPESAAGKILRKHKQSLSELTDIAGTMVVVKDGPAQDAAIKEIQRQFKPFHANSWASAGGSFDDYRSGNDGYRAVHFILDVGGKSVELQLKTESQKKWSALSHDTLYSKVPNPLKGNISFKVYMIAMSAYLDAKDRGKSAMRPPCPEVAKKLESCL